MQTRYVKIVIKKVLFILKVHKTKFYLLQYDNVSSQLLFHLGSEQ